VDLRQLRYFAQIVESGSLSKASRQLYIAQPALSQQVSKLEEEVGKPLLNRSSRGVAPTENGLALYHHARFMLRQLDQALSIARKESGAKVLIMAAENYTAGDRVRAGLDAVRGPAEALEHVEIAAAAAAADVANRTSHDVFRDPRQALVGIVGFRMDARPIAVERDVFLFGEERRPLAEIRGRIDTAKRQARRQPEQPAVPHDRGQQILDDEPDPVAGFASQPAHLLLRRSVTATAPIPMLRGHGKHFVKRMA